jgi:hypothetical protein
MIKFVPHVPCCDVVPVVFACCAVLRACAVLATTVLRKKVIPFLIFGVAFPVLPLAPLGSCSSSFPDSCSSASTTAPAAS